MKNFIDHGMLVADLKRQLEGMNDDDVVLIRSNYGDRNRTQQVQNIGQVFRLDHEQEKIEESRYSESGFAYAEFAEPELHPEEFDGDLEAYEEYLQEFKQSAEQGKHQDDPGIVIISVRS